MGVNALIAQLVRVVDLQVKLVNLLILPYCQYKLLCIFKRPYKIPQ